MSANQKSGFQVTVGKYLLSARLRYTPSQAINQMLLLEACLPLRAVFLGILFPKVRHSRLGCSSCYVFVMPLSIPAIATAKDASSMMHQI